jgi:Flp pilus assembly protein TadG
MTTFRRRQHQTDCGAGESDRESCQRCGLRGERGDVMTMTTILVVFLMLSSWALISASQQFGAQLRAQSVAAAAARAAAQREPGIDRGGFDAGNARERAAMIAAANGLSASVAINGTTVTVTVTVAVNYDFPSPGFRSVVTASSTASLIDGGFAG